VTVVRADRLGRWEAIAIKLRLSLLFAGAVVVALAIASDGPVSKYPRVDAIFAPDLDAGWIDDQRLALEPWSPEDVPDSGADAIRAAFALFPSRGAQKDYDETSALDWGTAAANGAADAASDGYASAERMVKAHGDALDELHNVARRPAEPIYQPTVPAMTAGVPMLAQARQLGRVGRMDALLKCLRGEDSAALERLEDVYGAGAALSHGDPLSMLSGWAIVDLADSADMSVLARGHVGRAELLHHARRLRDARELLGSFTEVLRWQAQFGKVMYDLMATADEERARDAVFSGMPPEARRMLDSARETGPPDERGASLSEDELAELRRRVVGQEAWSADRYARLIEASEKPLGDQTLRGLLQRAPADEKARGEGLGAFALLGDVYDRWLALCARMSGAEAGCYLRAYKEDHGCYPAALAELVPEYTNELPMDPWTGTSMLYASDGAGYKLYCVGPNLVDDGGKREGKQGLDADYVVRDVGAR